MAYRLDSHRIIDMEFTGSALAAPIHQTSDANLRSFGFPNSESPCKAGASAPLRSSSSAGSPNVSGVYSPALPLELSAAAATAASPTSQWPGSESPLRPSKRVGIFPHDEHNHWDFLKGGDVSHSTRLSATLPGVIASTVPRGLAHLPDRRPPTEAEIVAAASKEIRCKANAPVREQLMLRYMGSSSAEAISGGRKHFEVPCSVGEVLRDNTADDMQRIRQHTSPQPPQ